MGTSLSGLTPATTFDGLLKVGDNDPLTANLKAISTGDGTDTILQLSDSALQVNGDLNVGSVHKIYQDNTNLIIVGNSGSTSLKYFTNFGNNNTNQFGLNNFFRYPVAIGFTGVQSSATLNVKGSGTTSATTSLLVQNSSESNVFSITDDGLFTFNDPGGSDALTIENGNNISRIRYNDNLWLGSSHGTYAPTLKIDRTAGFSVETTGGSLLNLLYGTGNLGVGETTPTARLHVKGSGNDNTTTSFLVQNSDGTEHLKVTDDGAVNVRSNLNVNHITNSLRSLRLEWGSMYATDNAAELNIGAVWSQATAPKIILGGKTRAGGADAVLIQALNGMYLSTTANTEDPSAQLHIKGSGTTSATIALLVQKSDGVSILTLKDNGDFTVGGSSDLGIISGGRSRFRFGLLVGDTSSSETSAVLEAKSTTQGFLPPRMTDAERDAIATPAAGLMIYDTTNNQMNYWNGSTWIAF